LTDERTIPNVDRGSFLAVLLIWGFAGFWNGTLAFILYAAKNTDSLSRPALYAVASPFVLAGIFIAGLAFTLTIRVIRYRSLVLHLDTLPGVVGGRVAGTIHGNEGLLGEGMSIGLKCWRRARMSDSFDDMLWEDVVDVAPGSTMRSPAGATVPFRFDVPIECEPTSDDVYWRVAIQTRGHAAAGSFTVPISRTEQSSSEINEKSLRPRTISQPPYSKLRFERTADGAVEIRFPRPTWLWKWWLFTLVVAVAGMVGFPDYYFVVIAVVLVLVAIIQMGVFFSPRRLRVGRDELRMRFLSAFRGPKVMPSSELADFVAKFDNSTRKYDVTVQRADGQMYPWLMITAADKREAEWLAHELRAALGR
jgi:hypothetical protein